MVIDFNELKREIEELREVKESHENLKRSFGDKIKKINEKVIEVSSVLTEVCLLLSEIDPTIPQKTRKRRNGNSTDKIVNDMLFYLREHPTEELSMKWINDKYQIYGGSSQEVKKQLSNHPEVQTRNDPNYKKRLLFTYKKSIEIPAYVPEKISEQISKEERAFGIAEDKNSELKKSVPKKFSYLK